MNPQIKNELKIPEAAHIAAIHAVVVVVLALLVFIFSSTQQSLNSLLGGALIGGNIVLIVWTMKRLLDKKSVALAAFVIVIKYAAFIAVLVALYAYGWRANFGFVVGLTAALPTVAWVAYRYLKQSENDGSF